MGSILLLSRRFLTTPLNEKQLLTISSSCYKKKRIEYENTDQEKYRNLTYYLTSDKVRRGKCKLAAHQTETKHPSHLISLMNPQKTSCPEKSDQPLPLQFHLQRNNLASVTSILRQTMPAEQAFYLERWKQRMILKLGKEGFEEYVKNTFQKGNIFHAAIKALLLTKEVFANEQEEDTDILSYTTSVKHVLQDITAVRALESAVQHEALNYQGLVDCIAEYRGTLCVVDWKTSGKSKPSLQSTYDGPLQIAAYIGAINHDNNYNFQVSCGLLVIAYKDGSPAHSHFMDSELCSQYWNKWLLRLQEFKEKGKDSNTA